MLVCGDCLKDFEGDARMKTAPCDVCGRSAVCAVVDRAALLARGYPPTPESDRMRAKKEALGLSYIQSFLEDTRARQLPFKVLVGNEKLIEMFTDEVDEAYVRAFMTWAAVMMEAGIIAKEEPLRPTESLLALYADIDLGLIEDEKRAVLTWLKASNHAELDEANAGE